MFKYAALVLGLISALLSGCPSYRFYPTGNLTDAQGNPLDYEIQASIILPLSPPQAPSYTYTSVNDTLACWVSASDRDRVDSCLTTDSGQSCVEGWMMDEVISGSTPEDYHVIWDASRGDFQPKYGAHVRWQGIDPDGQAVETVTVTATVDDFQRGDEEGHMIGSPGDAAKSVTSSFKVWEVIITGKRSGQMSQYDDMLPQIFGCSFGGGILGPVNHADPSLCSGTCGMIIDGFYNNIEFKGTIPAAAPGVYTKYEFHQDIQGITTGFKRATQDWEILTDYSTRRPDGGALAGDKDSRSPNGAGGTDRDVVFSRDTPGLPVGCSISGWRSEYSQLKRDYHFWTHVRRVLPDETEIVVSVEYEWDDDQLLEARPDGTWRRVY